MLRLEAAKGAGQLQVPWTMKMLADWRALKQRKWDLGLRALPWVQVRLSLTLGGGILPGVSKDVGRNPHLGHRLEQ
eukprot:2919458-Amphidinium_carterae.3